ncbi:MAG TPA: cupin domain-containing protein [Candidatus Binataceae bacterium]|nr:cupin domain-containing protein [Candidatus Binataceae bacterium]
MSDVIPKSAAVRLALSGSSYIDVAALPWIETVPGLRMKLLYKDAETREAMMLVEAAPGSSIPEHVHGGVEWALVLEGTMEDDEGVVTAGNFVYRPAGSRHSVRMPNGAKYVGFFHGSARMTSNGQLFPSYED